MAEGHSLNETLGLIRVVSTDAEGHASLEYEAKREQCHSGGVVQGGFISGWIDAAMAHAAMAKNGPGIVPMTLELKVSYFAPIGSDFVATRGRRPSSDERPSPCSPRHARQPPHALELLQHSSPHAI